jgi:hypothetical protein
MDMFDAKKYLPSEAKNLWNNIDWLSSRMDLPPVERVEKIRESVRTYIAREPSAKSLQEALELEAYGVHTNTYILARTKAIVKEHETGRKTPVQSQTNSFVAEPYPLSIGDEGNDLYENLVKELIKSGALYE